MLETCQPPGGDPDAERGTSVPDPLGPMWTYTFSTSSLEAGVRCLAASGACGNGALLHAAWAALDFTRCARGHRLDAAHHATARAAARIRRCTSAGYRP